MLKKIKRYQRLSMLRKRDMSKEISNSNLLETEIIKNQSLIKKLSNENLKLEKEIIKQETKNKF